MYKNLKFIRSLSVEAVQVYIVHCTYVHTVYTVFLLGEGTQKVENVHSSRRQNPD